MKFEIDTDNKVIIINEEINLEELISWIKATVGIQGWKIRSNYNFTYFPSYPSTPVLYKTIEPEIGKDFEILCDTLDNKFKISEEDLSDTLGI